MVLLRSLIHVLWMFVTVVPYATAIVVLSPFAKPSTLYRLARGWPRKAMLKHPGVFAVSSGQPIPSTGRDPDELMREVETWIESEMRRLDPEAYVQESRKQPAQV